MALFVLSFCPFDSSAGVGAFVIGLSQISSIFSFSLVYDFFFICLCLMLDSVCEMIIVIKSKMEKVPRDSH